MRKSLPPHPDENKRTENERGNVHAYYFFGMSKNFIPLFSDYVFLKQRNGEYLQKIISFVRNFSQRTFLKTFIQATTCSRHAWLYPTKIIIYVCMSDTIVMNMDKEDCVKTLSERKLQDIYD